MKNGQPATKEDLANLKEELHGAMANLEEKLLEAIHDSETRLLKAFYNWAETTQQHLAHLDQTDNSFRQRLGTLEHRVMEIEKRLNMPPPR